MFRWWFTHIGGTMEYEGETHPHYLVRHPRDHVRWKEVGNFEFSLPTSAPASIHRATRDRRGPRGERIGISGFQRGADIQTGEGSK
ncbi:hypothetical protein AVDCRST_MAG82-74 [uncultured Rubrobacteraceae bacterium]|uniref:Uncharacterized protein n=1 Tax=uncultured Rubrobacteraceae bacterium TaxID=349277 RepID=A0A6J4NVL2_9ACTN|nr:hypothetical protein AVDCRST_MAG82-74 [uncultured Rubrobacteraceae bacterium]